MWRRPVAAAVGIAMMGTILMLADLGTARAGGLFLYEVGTPDMYTAGAGWAARAQDAATAFTNPAGMTRVKGGDLLLGAGALYGDIQFTPNANTTVSGGDGGTALGWLPNGGAYYTRAISEQWWFGFAATSNFGLSQSCDEGWVGRYYVEKSTLIGMSFVPSLAYRVNPHLSFGASLNTMYGIFKDDVAINNLLPSEGDGRLSLSDNALGLGGNFGVLCEPSDKLRLGLVYTSPVKLDFAAQPEFTNVGPGLMLALASAGLTDYDLGLGITVPQTVMTSFYSDVSPKWALMGNVGWQDWSQFGRVDVGVATNPPASLTTSLPYKDTYHGALGAKRHMGEKWLVSVGVGYDSKMVEDADRSVALPTGETWRYAIGAQSKMSEKFELGFGYTFVSCGNMPVDQNRGPLAGRVAGTYDNAVIHVMSLQGNWKF